MSLPSDLKPMHFEFTAERLQEADDRCAKCAERYQDYVYEKTFFAEMAKDFLCAMKLRLISEATEKMSDAEAETRARGSEEWKTFREEQFKRLQEAGRREIAYENAQRRWETARSGLSLRKEEAKRFIS